MQIDADVLLASSSGWAHGIRCTGRTIVYCHAPARRLYQRDRYLGSSARLGVGSQIRRRVAGAAVAVLDAPLRSWDRRRALAADRYLVNSSVVQQAVRQAYGIEAEVLPPPPAILPSGELEPISAVKRPFLLCVARLLPYKNVAEVILATKRLQELDLVVVGRGPDRERLLDIADGDLRIHLLGSVSDAALRWCYARCEALVAASYEDYGLSPLEAASFGKPTVAFRAGGYLDTLDEAVNGVFFDEPEPAQIAAAISSALYRSWDTIAIAAHVERFGKSRFIARLQAVIAEELG
jgi:glycosyltransferase involved in cell wall biosynthesis